MSKSIKIKYVLVICIMAFFAGLLVYKIFHVDNIKATSIREESSGYKFINPLLTGDDSQAKTPELNGLREKISEYIDSKKYNQDISQASVFYRQLDTGKWTGVNEDDPYAPGSMLKVAIMIGYLRAADISQNAILDKVYYVYKNDPGQEYKPKALEAGYYPIINIIQQMVIESDNSAVLSLSGKYDDDILKVYKDLKLPNPEGEVGDFMSARLYSRLFRVLYNATYLSRSYSEQALQLLTYTSFEKGLRVGVPNDIDIAHKFGERTVYGRDGGVDYRELHDCGIVFKSDHPYFLCVMTKGTDFKKLEGIIGGISKMVYDSQN